MLKKLYKKIKKFQFKKISLFLVAVCILFVLSFNFIFKERSAWSTFISAGSISGRLLKKDNILIFGTNYSKLYLVDILDQSNIHFFDLNTGNVSPREINKNTVLVTSDDTLRLVEIKNKKIIWQFSTDNQYFIVNASIHGNYVLAGSADGTLFKLNLKDGKLIWKFVPNKLDTLSSILLTGNLHYFGNFVVKDDIVYLASQDKIFYAIRFGDGSVKWKSEIGDMITTGPEIYSNYIYLSTKSGKSLALNKNTGSALWQEIGNSPVICANSSSSVAVNGVSQLFRKLLFLGKVSLFEFREDGTFSKRDGKSGKIVWQSSSFGETTVCPAFWKNEAIIAVRKGDVALISLKDGKKIFQKSNMGAVVNQPIIDPKFAKIIPEWLNIISPRIFVNNADGDLWALDGTNGKVLWKFSANAPTPTWMYVDKKYVFFNTYDGLIYKIDKISGESALSNQDKKYTIETTVNKVDINDIYEITLKTDSTFINPWREADIEAKFTNESGLVVTIPGFYYDKNIWKIRFNPPRKGEWKWELTWMPHGAKLISTGGFYSNTDTTQTYLRTNKLNPKRLTVDGKNIFNGMGLGFALYDYNYDGTSLDDWAIGDSEPLIATSSSGFGGRFNSDKLHLLNSYVDTYGPKGAGFNIFRWSLMNASQSLYTILGLPSSYSILQGKIGDEFAQTVKSNDIHIWFTIFGFDIPYKNVSSPVDKFILKAYVRNIYARYGAYVDVWELANELAVQKDVAKFLKNEITEYDYEKRPISISSSDYNYDDSDILAPHWYQTEDISQSDYITAKKLEDLVGVLKPVVFAEQGNQHINYDQTSGVRMRIRLWTAFYNQGILMFWNQTDTKKYESWVFPANLYIGTEERGYTKILQSLTSGFPLTSKRINYQLDAYGVRGYGLYSDKLSSAYFYHYGAPFNPITISLNLKTVSGGKVEWIEPSSGKILGTTTCNSENCILTSPIFNTDIAVFVRQAD